MLRSAYELQSDLHRIQSLLHQESFLFLTSEEKKRLLDESLKLDQRLNRITESFLVVGLLGGTGTGKSSLMNALACSPIAAASHRRPHTDQVLIYRHGAAPIPAALNKSSYPWREIVHEAEAVRQIILCDLPDFDSLLTKHREQVLQFLENLDILVWVTSPEKYADERFYAFLRQVSKARENFYFILNKVDLLFQPQEPEAGYLQLANLTARFSQHLGNNGIAQPIIYAVSTREGCDYGTTSPWNQLGSFRSQIFRLRDA
jgi:GTP-binding protein EngB required for normal cell division